MDKTYDISLIGCDDTTTITVQLTPEELAVLLKVEALLKAQSRYSCMPVMRVEEIANAEA